MKVKELRFSAEICEMGDGYVTLLHDGLLTSVPCNDKDAVWFEENKGKDVTVKMVVTLDE
jgi:hypothetical protein